MKDTIKIAGVTFSNPDGTNRQTILRNLGLGWKTAKLKQAIYDGKRAVEVYCSGHLIGYVPKTQLSNPLSNSNELTLLIEYYPGKSVDDVGVWHGTLSTRETPSCREYAYMKKLCKDAKLPMPAYDKRAYQCYWAIVKA